MSASAGKVEKRFPEDALTNPRCLLRHGGRQEYRVQAQKIMDAATGFVDFDRINVIPTSQCIIKKIRE
jgi:hypothetical protein